MMILTIKEVDIKTGKREIILNEDDSKKLGVQPGFRVVLSKKNFKRIFFASVSSTIIKSGEAIVSPDSGLKKGDVVDVSNAPPLKSTEAIKKKVYGNKLNADEIRAIVEDIVDENLSHIELASYVTAIQTVDLDDDEITYMIDSMVSTGESIKFDYDVYDVHSIGGVPGNKYALITVPILAAAGLRVPKTSSRAISSAAGTADVMEVLARVDLSMEEIKKVVDGTGAALVWGGALNLAPADDKIIRVEQPLGLDPQAQVISSVLAKKRSTGIGTLLIDIPMGEEAKVKNEGEARRLAERFIRIGTRIGIETSCAITYGGQPLGRAVGPAIEAQEALRALEGKQTSNSLIVKSIELASILLETSGVVEKGKGKDISRSILSSGKAREKMLEIINAQGSRGIEKSDDIELGKYVEEIASPTDGYISYVSNKAIVEIARTLGAPFSKKAGVWVSKKIGDKVEKNEGIFILYSENRDRLENALRLSRKLRLYEIEGMVLESIHGDLYKTLRGVKK
ncbi:MAG: AMP phosphorylase [Thermoplasmata archaeon]